MYDAMHASQPGVEGRSPRLLHLAVHRETPVPVVETLIRIPGLGDHGYGFVGAVTVPLADCSWVVKVESYEVGSTGVRVTLAGARFRREHRGPESSIEELAHDFDPYDAQWDLDENDPLTSVRQSTNKLLVSLEVDPEVRQATSFR